MSSKTKHIQWDDLPLFASEDAIGSALLGQARAGEFHERATLLEGDGFPKIDNRWGGRYTPAIRRWFDLEYGLVDASLRQPSGVERPEAWTRIKQTA